MRAHILPLTNCAFNKSGDRFITGSYDRTCKVWNTLTGEELLTLEGHKNVVYAIAFNNPSRSKSYRAAPPQRHARPHGGVPRDRPRSRRDGTRPTKPSGFHRSSLTIQVIL